MCTSSANSSSVPLTRMLPMLLNVIFAVAVHATATAGAILECTIARIPHFYKLLHT